MDPGSAGSRVTFLSESCNNTSHNGEENYSFSSTWVLHDVRALMDLPPQDALSHLGPDDRSFAVMQ